MRKEKQFLPDLKDGVSLRGWDEKYLTAPTVTLFDAEIHPPPKGAVLLILSKYNVLTKGTFQPGFHVAWGYLPKTPASVKQRMSMGATT